MIRPIRFIPARAGNTVGLSTTASAGSVHPRPRGEHERAIVLVAIVAGSSPPARGTLEKVFDFLNPCAVHPRPRGEHSILTVRIRRLGGSSPPARGTLGRYPKAQLGHRFIPARAGNTRHVFRLVRSDPVHPRPRGEHIDAARVELRKGGSSPPARGTPLDRAVRRRSRRFIPARAGNTASRIPDSGSSPPAGEHLIVGRDPQAVHPRPPGNT